MNNYETVFILTPTFRLDKYAKEYADKRRSRRASAPAEATATEVEQAPAAE